MGDHDRFKEIKLKADFVCACDCALPVIDVDFVPLFSCLNPDLVIDLMSAFMSDQVSVVLLSHRPSLRVKVIEAIMALLYPLDYNCNGKVEYGLLTTGYHH